MLLQSAGYLKDGPSYATTICMLKADPAPCMCDGVMGDHDKELRILD